MATKYQTIVIPGFGGSQLSFSGGKGGKTVLWYDPVNITKYTPLSLGLNTDGSTPWPLVGKQLFADGPVDFGIYEPLVTSLAGAGLRPLFWAYDWRKGANVLANQLAIFLASGRVTSPFSIVAHSYGGLVAQLAYPLYQLTGPGAVWGKTVYLGTPQGGAHWAGAALSGLFSAGSELAMLGQLLKIPSITFPGLKQTFQAVQGIAGSLVGSWPGLYCLLPNPNTPWAALDPNAAKFLQLATYANTPGGQQQQWLTAAATVLQTLGNNWAQPRPVEAVIVGGDRSTLATLDDIANPQALASYGTTNDGDGTVITARATNPPPHGAQFKRTGHNEVCFTRGPAAKLIDFLETAPTSFEVLPNAAPVKYGPPQNFTIDFPPVPSQPFVNTHLDP